MGLSLLEGKVPYRDIFDQKGPFLWFIQAAGLWINFKYGIFLLQIVSLTTTALIWHMIARLFTSHRTSIIITLTCFVPLIIYIHGGNQCEEWMLPYISLSYLLALKQIKYGSEYPHIIRNGFLYGVLFGLVCYLRVNDALAQCGSVMLGIGLFLLYRKQFKSAFIHAGMCVLGFFAITIPIVSFYVYHNAITDLIYGMFTYSMSYSGGLRWFIYSLYTSSKIAYALLPIAVLISVSLCHYRSSFAFIFIPAAVLGYVCLGPSITVTYPALSLVPLMSISIVLITYKRNGSNANNSYLSESKILYIILGIYYFVRIATPINSLIDTCSVAYGSKCYYAYFYNEGNKLLNNIPQNEKNSVWNYNLGYQFPNDFITDPGPAYNGIFVHHGFTQCNRVLLLQQVVHDHNLAVQEIQSINRVNPKWIVMTQPDVYRIMEIEQIIAKKYELIANTDTTICNIHLYRRIE